MKIYKLPQLADSNPEAAFQLGPPEGSGGVYLCYCRLVPGRTKRHSSCGDSGCVVFVVKGSVVVRFERKEFTVSEGEAFRAEGPGELVLAGTGAVESAYVLTGEAAEAPEGPPDEGPEGHPQGAGEPPSPQPEEDEFEITLDDEPDPA